MVVLARLVLTKVSDQKKVLDAFGGKKGLLDSGIPSILFLITYNLSKDLSKATIAALALALCLTIFRLVRKDSIQHVISGLIGVAFCAFLARKTGSAVDYYLPGLITNLAYGSIYAIANLIGFPILGLMLGPILGENLNWRKVAARKRAYLKASWLWVALFASRLLVQYPLYKSGNLTALGSARLAMGYPLFAAVAWGSWLIIRKTPAAIAPEKSES
jgi:intracellular septation protein A